MIGGKHHQCTHRFLNCNEFKAGRTSLVQTTPPDSFISIMYSLCEYARLVGHATELLTYDT